MSSSEYMVLVPAGLVAGIASSDASWGYLNMRFETSEKLAIVTGFWRKEEYGQTATDGWLGSHYSRDVVVGKRGLWFDAQPELNSRHRWMTQRGNDYLLNLDVFRELVRDGWKIPGQSEWPVLTLCSEGDGPGVAGWWVSANGARPAQLAQVDDRSSWSFLTEEQWPVATCSEAKVTVVGLGSIGSAVAEALAFYGIGNLALVDPDRLLQHNVVRHQLSVRDIGRHKVNATAEHLRSRWPELKVDRYPLDVSEDADVMRPLFARSDLIICTADGVTARRVTNHLARRARKPLVLACVLESGALGEVMRLRAGRGCLLCQRADLVARRSLDPEPRLDRGYGLGTRHLPMTAIGGDLRLVADFAAKAAVATLLERKGDFSQALPDDVFTVGLRPVPDLEEPFDLTRSCETRWSSLPPKRPDCPTCGSQ
jgi:hypothetical protein